MSELFKYQRVLVCGGRDYNDRAKIYATLDSLSPKPEGDEANATWLPRNDLMIVAGGAPGADSIAIDWAVVNWVKFKEYPVDHGKDGPWPGAGPKRNERMLLDSEADLVIAFPGGRGTASMKRIAERYGIRVIEVSADDVVHKS